MNKKEKRYQEMLNETMHREQLVYLTVVCSTRSKKTASRAKGLLQAGDFAKALKTADPVGYQVGLNEFH